VTAASDPAGDPVAALERAAYLMERGLAGSAKVGAFRKAAATIAAMDPAEVVRLVRAGKITDLAGIGKSTGGVISDAVLGRPSAYLADLERSTAIDPGRGGALRALLKGDCHTHSLWSDGGATIEAMARTAIDLGHEWLVMTDHSPRMSIARGLSPERLAAQLEEIADLNGRLEAEGRRFRVLTGMEVDINEDGSLDAADEVLAALDVVVASPHIKLKMDRPAMTRRLVLAAAHPHVDILGHCTGRKVGWGSEPVRAGADFDADLVFAACAQHGTAVEVNCRPERQDPPDELIELALEWGCKLSVDTDAHAPGQLEFLDYGCARLAGYELDAGRILNTRSAADLLRTVSAG
jgi:putative hydrolase